MHNPEYIEGRLAARTNAKISDKRAENNRWIYQLFFDENIGWDWFQEQVRKSSEEIDVPLEPYKFGPVEDADAIVVEVRELQRREGIDDEQKGLDSFADTE